MYIYIYIHICIYICTYIIHIFFVILGPEALVLVVSPSL